MEKLQNNDSFGRQQVAKKLKKFLECILPLKALVLVFLTLLCISIGAIYNRNRVLLEWLLGIEVCWIFEFRLEVKNMGMQLFQHQI